MKKSAVDNIKNDIVFDTDKSNKPEETIVDPLKSNEPEGTFIHRMEGWEPGDGIVENFSIGTGKGSIHLGSIEYTSVIKLDENLILSIILLFGWGSLALINAGLAQAKNRKGLNWFLLSLVLGPIATFALVACFGKLSDDGGVS